MAIIKEQIESDRKKLDEERAVENALHKACRELENEEVIKVEKLLKKALTGYRPKKASTGCISVKIRSRTVHITYGYRTYTTRYSDESDEVQARSLFIDIGFFVNEPIRTTSVEHFVEDFIHFLERNQLN